MQMLMKKLEEMAAKLKGDTGLSLAANTHEGHRKSIKDHSRRKYVIYITSADNNMMVISQEWMQIVT